MCEMFPSLNSEAMLEAVHTMNADIICMIPPPRPSTALVQAPPPGETVIFCTRGSLPHSLVCWWWGRGPAVPDG